MIRQSTHFRVPRTYRPLCGAWGQTAAPIARRWVTGPVCQRIIMAHHPNKKAEDIFGPNATY
jgi:hypothetical protein